MKQGTLITKIVMFVLFVGVVAYLCAAAWQSFSTPFSTVLTYAYTSDDVVETTGFLIRAETVIPGQSTIVDVLPAVGEKVGANQTVAYLYRDQAALERKQQLHALELREEQLGYALKRESASWDNQSLENSIINAVVNLRASTAAGMLSHAEEETLKFKSLVLSREYAGSPAEIDAQLQAIAGEKEALRGAVTQDTTPVRVSQAGVFSTLADGYETLLTPELLESLTPTALDQLDSNKPATPEGAVGKLITSSRWYFASAVSETDAARLVEGKEVTVRFSRDWSGDVAMRVERMSPAENGRVAVVLSSTRFLSETILLRQQTVEIVFHSTTGIRVPKMAMRSENRSVTDEETGEVTERTVVGVYTITGAQSEFKPVRILVDDGDYYLVEAALPENPTTAQIKKALRAGDEVIVAATELYDGKVVL